MRDVSVSLHRFWIEPPKRSAHALMKPREVTISVFGVLPTLGKMIGIAGDEIVCLCRLRAFQKDVVVWIRSRRNAAGRLKHLAAPTQFLVQKDSTSPVKRIPLPFQNLFVFGKDRF